MSSVRCHSCGYDNPPEARFCANCGSSLVAAAEQPVPTAVTGAELLTPEVTVEYMGFWIRFGAAVIDGVIIFAISMVLNFSGGRGLGFPFGYLIPAIGFVIPWLYYWLFTGLKGQTIGKMALGIKVVNSRGSVPGLGYAALREIIGKIVSTIVIYLGFLWIIWDRQKQGWHDKIASTYVIRVKSGR